MKNYNHRRLDNELLNTNYIIIEYEYLVRRCIEEFGEDLISVVLFGSNSRGLARNIDTICLNRNDALKNFEYISPLFSTLLLGIKILHDKDNFFKKGQILWQAVVKDETSSYGKSMGDTRTIPVILTLVSDEEINMRINGSSITQI